MVCKLALRRVLWILWLVVFSSGQHQRSCLAFTPSHQVCELKAKHAFIKAVMPAGSALRDVCIFCNVPKDQRSPAAKSMCGLQRRGMSTSNLIHTQGCSDHEAMSSHCSLVHEETKSSNSAHRHTVAESFSDKKPFQVEDLDLDPKLLQGTVMHNLVSTGNFLGFRSVLQVLSDNHNFPYLLNALQAKDDRVRLLLTTLQLAAIYTSAPH